MFYIPGGKREYNETDRQCLVREIKEELSVMIKSETMQLLGVFVTQADSHKQGINVKMTCYYADYVGQLSPSSEIEEYKWLSYEDRVYCSKVDQLIFDHLHKESLLY
ncbi:NUDIX hydrolase [Vibrio europaeus]|uniref:NUDIX hydrolase n=1 Tax=Vibrio europaeus TaxID=300876 RepID=UPI0039E0C9AF